MSRFKSVYFASPRVSAFDDVIGSEIGSAPSPVAAPVHAPAHAPVHAPAPAAAPAPAPTFSLPQPNVPPGTPDGFIPQGEFNRILAEERRKAQTNFHNLERNYQEMVAANQVNQADRDKMEKSLSDIQATFRTKEEEAKHKQKLLEETYTKRLADAEKKATDIEKQYHNHLIKRELKDAAMGGEAYNPDHVVAVMRDYTTLVPHTDEQGRVTGEMRVVCDFPDVDQETGQMKVLRRSPTETVKRMQELPQTYGHFWRSNVVSGIGGASGSAQGGAPTSLDVAQMSQEQYNQMRRSGKLDSALGLRAVGTR